VRQSVRADWLRPQKQRRIKPRRGSQSETVGVRLLGRLTLTGVQGDS